ncbi:Arginine-requiring protein 2 [Cladobotryum mycophilum]|uniref:Amino-acid acetyltransferase, mitochondrial n=1 Tax=Cladobotryum mycophilum TaxID=491253 RepID=A0ABR0T164_9HYPO
MTGCHSLRLFSYPTRPRWHAHLLALVVAETSISYLTPTSRLAGARWLSSPSAARVKRHALDRDVVVSVLEASATRRDAKNYLQKYATKSKSLTGPINVVQDRHQPQTTLNIGDPVNVAIMSLRSPQHLQTDTIYGIAKTLTQLRVLGLLSVVVIDCGVEEDSATFQEQALRLCEAIDSFGKPGVKLAQSILSRRHQHRVILPSLFWDDVRVEDQGLINRALQNDMMVVIPSLACQDEISTPQPTDAHRTILALTKYFTGMQFEETGDGLSLRNYVNRPNKIASVERVIILDALGGTPVPGRPGVCQRFVNLEQEYDALLKHLMGPEGSPLADDDQTKGLLTTHAANLRLAKDTLSLLPATSSAIITTPFAAANTKYATTATPTILAMNDSRFDFEGMVTTRKKQNPLLHNLLTDKPVFSSSLPIKRVQTGAENYLHAGESVDATLVKRGMPLTIYPDPRTAPWSPPKPGSPRSRLTDRCIDLPRLANLIEDSFGRKLDLDDYLKRVNDNLAGIIIAGEYEGGAILTWERPDGIDDLEASEKGRYVPYLDKFAVLKSRQGSGGVADIVFNAMIRDCFPRGVCWRSRKNNPVNKWYFERSIGTSKLADSNWTMFWTTLGLVGEHPTLRDYESVCRGVVPSWANDHHILD